MFLIVGLGNPGLKYSGTRHNVGFMVVNHLAKRWNINIDKRKFNGRTGTGQIADQQVMLLKPSTYMNHSGSSVRSAYDFYKIEPESMLIILDDLALPTGQIRIRTKGSDGGHKGLADVVNRIGTDQIPRIRIGIGSPPPMIDAVEYVLARFLEEEKEIIDQTTKKAADAVEFILNEGYPKAMEKFNSSQ